MCQIGVNNHAHNTQRDAHTRFLLKKGLICDWNTDKQGIRTIYNKVYTYAKVVFSPHQYLKNGTLQLYFGYYPYLNTP